MQNFSPSPYIPPSGDSKKFMNKLLGHHVVYDTGGLHELAGALAQEISAGDVFLLDGSLGSGKTTFVRTLGTELGAENIVTSPTFTIAAEYDIPHSHIINQMIHLDLYRFNEGVPQEDKAYINELISTATQLKRIVLIEWAEKLGDAAPQHAWKLHFEHGQEPNERTVSISKS